MKVIVYTRDNKLCVCYPTAIDLSKKQLDELIKKDIPENAKNITIMDSKDLPKDRYFRNAWEFNNGKAAVNKEKAIDIHINKLRAKRNEKLKQLDIKTMKALQASNPTKLTEINLLAQDLREMPKVAKEELTKLKSLEDIKNYIPECLEK